MAADETTIDSSNPVIVKEEKYRILWGLVRIHYLIEDRRPDLSAEDYRSKYKHHITVKVLTQRFSWVLRSHHSYVDCPYRG